MNRSCGSLYATICLLFCLGLLPAVSSAQQAKPAVSVLKRFEVEENEIGIVVHSLDVFQSDVDRLFTDLGQEGLKPVVRNVTDSWKRLIDPEQPMLLKLSTSFQGMIFGTPPNKNQREGFEETDPIPASGIQFFKVHDEHFLTEFELAGIDGDNIVLGRRAEDIQQLLELEPLSTELDEGSRELFNESGIAFYSQANNNPLDNNKLEWKSLTAHEQRFLAELKEKFDQPSLGMVGMKYHEKTFDVRFRIQLSEKMDDLFRTDLPSSSYDPDLGMMAEGLLAAASLRTDVARDSAFMRLLPSFGLDFGSSNRQFGWLGGSTLRVLFELIGDSWVDLEVARGALYQGTPETGKLTFIGIVDCRDPAIVMRELRRISTLTQPLQGNELTEQQLEELHRLVELLASDDQVHVARAETRLALAGPRALKQLELRTELVDPKIADSLERIMRRIRSEAKYKTTDLQVMDPEFWSRLRPGLKLSEDTGKIDGNPVHTIKITPDPGKSELEVEQATAAMVDLLGNQWDQIQMVQVKKHMIFMIGSDEARLKKVVTLVQQGKGELDSRIPKFGNPNKSGAMQVYAFLGPTSEVMGALGSYYQPPADPKMSFGSWDIEEQSMQMQFLIPTDSIIPFLRGAMF